MSEPEGGEAEAQSGPQQITVYLGPFDAHVPEFYANLSALAISGQELILLFGKALPGLEPDQNGQYKLPPSVRIIMPLSHLPDLFNKLSVHLQRLQKAVDELQASSQVSGGEERDG